MSRLICVMLLVLIICSQLIFAPVEASTPPAPRYTYGGNVIDNCWRYDPNWSKNRMHLADCAIGFGKNAMGGKGGRLYVVTDPGDDPVHPAPGTLRYGTVQIGPIWIVFASSMSIRLKQELMVNSYTTIDGRGANVVIGNGGPCLTVQFSSHVIIHGLTIINCVPGSHGTIMTSVTHTGDRNGADGDAIAVFGSNNVWIDHNFLSHATDGLIDVIHASNMVTISNNHFTNHDKVMLLGHSDSFSADKAMKVTVVYNYFSQGCVERMPRVRFGYAHVVNNHYENWLMYAVGGSAGPRILSEANWYAAGAQKQVTKREASGRNSNWIWKSQGDLFLNGAFFVQSGSGSADPGYTIAQRFAIRPAASVPQITASAGALHCSVGRRC